MLILHFYVDLIAQNFILVLLTGFFWSCWAFNNLLEHLKYQLLIKYVYDIKD